MWHAWGRGEEFLVGRPEGKRLLGIHRCRWEDNMKMDLGETDQWGKLDLAGSE
jgi:hypothetical protein